MAGISPGHDKRGLSPCRPTLPGHAEDQDATLRARSPSRLLGGLGDSLCRTRLGLKPRKQPAEKTALGGPRVGHGCRGQSDGRGKSRANEKGFKSPVAGHCMIPLQSPVARQVVPTDLYRQIYVPPKGSMNWFTVRECRHRQKTHTMWSETHTHYVGRPSGRSSGRSSRCGCARFRTRRRLGAGGSRCCLALGPCGFPPAAGFLPVGLLFVRTGRLLVVFVHPRSLRFPGL